jgi:Putative beta barrel porin-7 (BBP7)
MRYFVHSTCFATIATLLIGSLAPAAADDRTVKPGFFLLQPRDGSFWVGAEYLGWSAKGDKLPPLVTTSPPGTPRAQSGVIGAPGTSVLFGDDSANDGWRSGVRLRAGYWFDSARTEGIEVDFFVLGQGSADFAMSSGGNPILARPFFNTSTGLQDSMLIAFPGFATGSVAVSETTRLLGGGGAYRRELCKSCAFGSVSGLVGYRFLSLQDNLAINSTSLVLAGPLVGDTSTASDQFQTSNYFHGLDLGLTGEIPNGRWTMTWLAKLAVGATFSNADISGFNTIVPPGGPATVTPGGLYAQPTNIGNYSRGRFALAPELGVNVNYLLTDNLRAFAGYSLLYWTGLIRPSNAIDTTVNPSQLGGGALVGSARPQAQLSSTDYWAHGFNFGVAYNF